MTASIEELRAYFKGSPMHAVLLEGLIPEAVAAAVRERVRPLVRPFFLADRGRYAVDETHREPEVFAGLADLASRVVEQPVTPARARWTRLVHGDYALYKDDSRVWAGLDRHLEVILDVSAARSDDAQVVYSDGGHILWIPQAPMSGALVDRRQVVQRYDRYLTHRVGDAEVFRLSLALRVVD